LPGARHDVISQIGALLNVGLACAIIYADRVFALRLA